MISPASPFLVGRRWLGEGMHALLPPAAEHLSTLRLAKSMTLSVVILTVLLLVMSQYVLPTLATIQCTARRPVGSLSPLRRRTGGEKLNSGTIMSTDGRSFFNYN